MYFEIDNQKYKVDIIKKNIKHIYVRVKNNVIVVTSNKYSSIKKINKLLEENKLSIKKMLDRERKKIEKSKKYYLLGTKYDIVLCNITNKAKIIDNVVYAKNLNNLETLSRKIAKEVFYARLKLNYDLIEENIPYPKLNIRKMKQKWGYCNKKSEFITLNLDLIKYNMDEIDYVIIHELCHFIHFNHSKDFWNVVAKYKPNYKSNRKVLREE